MFCLDAVIVCRCVSSADMFIWGSSWSCIDIWVVSVCLACKYMIVFSPCLCLLYLGEVCGGCEPIASQIHSVHNLRLYLKSILILPSHHRLGLPGDLSPEGFLPQICIQFSPMHATYPVRFILIDLIILILFGEGYKLWSTPLCNFLLLHHTSYVR
jgi:hypothetical protein